ncbi:Enterochelin esterase [Mariniphaga anaerophila]|uniref:Enterochelin esterase n=1 Tax=Mariniphaga anaerophila TaxID=1484053 RepID=A0A1M4WB18_9BACT|nr:alpha/beta hydrolase-fold protein [Mariniphaga anaerophila]SHE78162.1 Enterochelin esterase [Mariniphaga anaerophila]
MNNRIITTICAFIIALSAGAQTGKVFDNLSLNSEILNMERKYAIYLPPDYETSQRSYPVLYLLHGAGDDQTGWVQFGEVQQITDKAIKDGVSTAMIVVMPDANTGQRGYTNDVSGNWRFEDFFFEEFIPFIEDNYRIREGKSNRAIAGLSMGGGGTFYYALHRPDMFSAACPLSASTGPLTREGVENFMQRRGMPDAPKEKMDAWYQKYSVTEMVKNLPEEDLKAVRWYIDCGDDDFLFEGNSLVHITLKKRNIPHEYRVRDGVHNWTYWRESLPEVLRFVSAGFHRQ